MPTNGRSRRKPGASATIEDVARLAGVSRATASRVANNSPKVSPEARAAVQAAIARLGYVPNRAARSLMTRRSDSIGVVIMEPAGSLFADPFFGNLLVGISDGLAARDIQLVLLMAQTAREEARVERYLEAGHVDGAILVGPHGVDPVPARLDRQGVPIVLSGRQLGDGGVSHVDSDNRGGARAAVAHLLDSGRRSIATIHGTLDLSSGIDRLEGYRDALREAGLPLDAGLEGPGNFHPVSAADAMRELLERRPGIDAVFAASDSMAAAAMRVLQENGRRVPEDVAVVGFDDSPIAITTRPELSTVRQPIEAMGREMARLLLYRIDNPGEAPSQVVFNTELVVRASSGGALASSGGAPVPSAAAPVSSGGS
jgi:DNA-binding LacI/PurR family transcriptional regulator